MSAFNNTREAGKEEQRPVMRFYIFILFFLLRKECQEVKLMSESLLCMANTLCHVHLCLSGINDI